MKREVQNTLKIIATEDGSSSLYHPELDETYHSRHGAVQEALHVFISMGLKHQTHKKSEISILEVGFGTGLNCYLTAEHVKANAGLSVAYTGIDNTPLPKEQLESLSYFQKNKDLYSQIHAIEWDKESMLTEHFKLIKKELDFLTSPMDKNKFDLIYFDAFGPRAQESMWHINNFKNLYESMRAEGTLVTYCAKGQVRRDLQEVGFTVERLPGPPGKREMLRATKED